MRRKEHYECKRARHTWRTLENEVGRDHLPYLLRSLPALLHPAYDALVCLYFVHDLLAPDNVFKELSQVRAPIIGTVKVGIEINRLEHNVECPLCSGKLALARAVVVLRFAEHVLDLPAVPEVRAGT